MSSTAETGPRVPLSDFQELARRAVLLWDVDVVALEPIKVRENAVFRVCARDGGRAALRIHRRGYHSAAALRSEFQWAEALRRSGIDAPHAIPSRAGRQFEEVGGPESVGMRQVDLLAWMDGVQLGSVESGLAGDAAGIRSAYRAIGALAARMHNQASRWQRPAGFVRHAWDLEGLVGEHPLWGRFWELEDLTPAQLTVVEKARARLRVDLARFGTSDDRYGLIHADLVPENVLVNGDRFAVIDFDDAGYGWHLFELATTLYFVRTEEYYPSIVEALISGYREHRALPDAHLRYLPAFLAARGLTYLGWVHTRRGEPAAQELAPMLTELALAAASHYLAEGSNVLLTVLDVAPGTP